MRKKIATEQAVIGMFVDQFCGSWINHPFWGKRQLIANENDLRKIRASGISHIVIDLNRGLDAAREVSAVAAAADTDLAHDPALNGLPDSAAASQAQTPVQVYSCSLADELVRAEQLLIRGKRDLKKMFADVRMGRAVESEVLQLLVTDMAASLMRNTHALTGLVRIKRKDEYTYLHSFAVATLMIALARGYGCDDKTVELAGMAGLMHDVGKVAMPDHILNKPGRLTDAEIRIMRGHPRAGAKMLEQVPDLRAEVIDACLHHHEKMDGSGYPDKLVGEQINLLTRMAAICDVYDAITSNRPYHKGEDPSNTLSRMAGWKGHFDSKLFQLFVRILGIYPVGSLVRLASDRLAVVVEQSTESLLTPKLRVFYSIPSRKWIPLQALDLAADDGEESITGREEPETWGLAGLDRLWTDTHFSG